MTQYDKADITPMEELRSKFKAQVQKAGGNLTVTAVLVKVLAAALKRFGATGNVQDASQTVHNVCESESNRLDAELAILRFSVWVTPALGFVGTVVLLWLEQRWAEDVNLVALCDVDETLLTAATQEVKAKTYTDYRELLASEKNLDAVIIATPDHWHAPIARAAMGLVGKLFVMRV